MGDLNAPSKVMAEKSLGNPKKVREALSSGRTGKMGRGPTCYAPHDEKETSDRTLSGVGRHSISIRRGTRQNRGRAVVNGANRA